MTQENYDKENERVEKLIRDLSKIKSPKELAEITWHLMHTHLLPHQVVDELCRKTRLKHGLSEPMQPIKGAPGREYIESPSKYTPVGMGPEEPKLDILSEIEDVDVETEGSLIKAKRDLMEDVRYDLISPFIIESLAKTYAEGKIKYGAENWRKGLPFSNCINHAMNHLMKYMMGDTSEPHLDHALWNIGAMIEYRDTGRESELNDLFFHQNKEAKKEGRV